MSSFLKMCTFAFIVLFVTACVKPIYNTYNRSTGVADSELDMDQISKIIGRAGINRGWVMKQLGEGLIEATYTKKQHVAVVNITFDRRHYNIKYKSSVKLRYSNGKIHNNYNRWIKFLEDDISFALRTTSSAFN